MKFHKVCLFAVSQIIIIGNSGCTIIFPPNLSNVRVCDSLDTSGGCLINNANFKNNKQKFFVTADIKNIPNDASIKVDWKYVRSTGSLAGKELPLITNTIQAKKSAKFVVASIDSPSSGWQLGKYRVQLSSSKVNNSKPYIKEFSITP
jgi:hypothetical protein